MKIEKYKQEWIKVTLSMGLGMKTLAELPERGMGSDKWDGESN